MGAAVGAFLLSSCAPVLFVGAATGGVVAASERTAGAFLEDAGIELKAARDLDREIGDRARYSVTSINRVVLVTGQAPDNAVKNKITEVVSRVANVRKVVNEVSIGGQLALGAIASDAAVTAKVKAALLGVQEADFSSLDIKVVTENNVVYLMGLVNRRNAVFAVEASRNVSGVHRVVRLFEFTD